MQNKYISCGRASCRKIIPHSVFRVGVFLGEASRNWQREGGTLLGTLNGRSLYGAGSLKAAVRELARNKLDLMDVQYFRWDKGGTLRAGDNNFLYGNEMKIISWQKDFMYSKV